MNKKVLKIMIALVVIFLAGLYVLKIFFPAQFVLAIENEQMILIGNYIDSHDWARYLFGIITSFITYSLYCSATTKRWFLKWYEYLYILIAIGLSIVVPMFFVELGTYINIFAMIILPCIMGADLKTVSIVYGIHGLSQILSLSIRSLPLYMTSINALTRYAVGIECWLWLILFYLFYNYKSKKEI